MSEKTNINDLIKLPVRKVNESGVFGHARMFILERDETEDALCQFWNAEKGDIIAEAINSHQANLERIARLEKEKAELVEIAELYLGTLEVSQKEWISEGLDIAETLQESFRHRIETTTQAIEKAKGEKC